MSDDKPAEQPPLQVLLCGPSTAACQCACPDGPCEHVWDGEEEEGEETGGVYYSTTTCSRCGMTSMAHSMWVGP